MISVIISCFNEAENPYFSKIIEQYAKYSLFDLLFIDGGSTDSTLDILQAKNLRYHELKASTRAARLNFGIQHAASDYILLQHPRSLISADGLTYIKQTYKGIDWAAFTHEFDNPHFFLKFISWYSNAIRVQKKHITYLDHCIFLNRTLLKDPLPDIAIFEDTELSYQLRKHTKPTLIKHPVTTSAIRFIDRGILRQFLVNQWVKYLYHRKVSANKINRVYEKRLNLNQRN